MKNNLVSYIIAVILIIGTIGYAIKMQTNQQRAMLNSGYVECQNSCRLLGGAIAKYNLDNKSLPPSLEDLKPTLLKALPTCASTKNDYGYLCNNISGGFTVYCKGSHKYFGVPPCFPMFSSDYDLIFRKVFINHTNRSNLYVKNHTKNKSSQKPPGQKGRIPMLVLIVSPQEAYDFSDIPTFKETIKKHPNSLTERDDAGRTVLFEAVTYRNLELFEAILDNSPNKNIMDNFGRTPLFEAVSYNKPKIIELLVTKGANLNIQDKDGETPLFIAVKKRNKPVIELLLKLGANPNIKNKWGQSVFQKTNNNDIIRILEKRGN